MASDKEIQELIEELQKLNVRQHELLQRISSAAEGENNNRASQRRTREEQSNNTDNQERTQANFSVGDEMTFKGTTVTRGGSGVIVRFTTTRAVIRRPNGTEVQRAPRNLRATQPTRKIQNK